MIVPPPPHTPTHTQTWYMQPKVLPGTHFKGTNDWKKSLPRFMALNTKYLPPKAEYDYLALI